jgi:hypothetical protein
MDQLFNTAAFILLIGAVLSLALSKMSLGLITVSRKAKKAEIAPWSFVEFLQLRLSQRGRKGYYRFAEEQVRSSAHRFVGRFDAAVLHWEEAPILDVMIEYKYPVNMLPRMMGEEDCFQMGLYALALEEYGVSCGSAKLVAIYCLQDVAKRCLQDASNRNCFSCGQSKIFEKRFEPDRVRRHLKKLDEVWYGKRSVQATPSKQKCRSCPFSKQGECKYAEA